MKHIPELTALLLLTISAHAQSPAARLNEMLGRLSSGHTPTPEEIAAVQTLDPAPSADAVREAVSPLNKALDNPDPALRTYALTLLNALATPPDTTTPAPPAATVPGLPAAFKSETAKALAPAIPQIAARLADDEKTNRLLAANALGGFAPNPPAAVYAPLLAYLKRDDGIGPTGTAVVNDLLEYTPITTETAAAVTTYLRRSDQSADSRSNLVDAIASKPQQNQAIDQTLLTYLASDDNSLRARVILSLPQLDLSPDVFTDTRSRIAALAALDAAGGQENLQVVNAAKAVTGCWTQVKMTTGCPTY